MGRRKLPTQIASPASPLQVVLRGFNDRKKYLVRRGCETLNPDCRVAAFSPNSAPSRLQFCVVEIVIGGADVAMGLGSLTSTYRYGIYKSFSSFDILQKECWTEQ